MSALGYDSKLNGLELIDRLAQVTGTSAPKPLLSLKDKKVRFKTCVASEDMPKVVMEMLKA